MNKDLQNLIEKMRSISNQLDDLQSEVEDAEYLSQYDIEESELTEEEQELKEELDSIIDYDLDLSSIATTIQKALGDI